MKKNSIWFLMSFVFFSSIGFASENLTVNQCVEKAIENNLDIKNAILGYKQNETDMLKTLGRYIPGLGGGFFNNRINEPSAANSFVSYPIDAVSITPNVSMGLPGGGFLKAEYTLQDSSSPSTLIMGTIPAGGDSYTRKFAFTYTQPLLQNFLFIPTDINVLRMATSSRKIAKYVIFQAAEGIAFSSYMNYINLIINNANVIVKSNSLERARLLLKRNLENKGLGLVEDTDILGSKALLNIRDADFSTTKNAEVNIINSLKQLMNDSSDFTIMNEINLTCNLSTNVEAYKNEVEAALSNRIELKLLREQERLMNLNILIAKSQLLPQLNFVGTWSRYGNDANKDTAYHVMADGANKGWVLGLNLNMPIVPLASMQDLKKQKMELEKIHNNIEKTVLQIKNQVSAQVKSIQLLQKQFLQMEEAAEFQKQRLQKEEEKFRLGRSSTRFLIQAQDDLENAETQMLALRWRYYISLISLEYYKGLLLKNCNSAIYSKLDSIK